MLPLLLFVIGPIADLVLLVRFGQSFGFLTTVAVVLGTAALGGTIVRTRGIGAAARLGGVLLVLPGLITDVIGLALLFPPTRFLLRAITRRWIEGAMKSGALKVSVLRWDAGFPPSQPPSAETPIGLDPRNEILIKPSQGGGDPTFR